MLAEEGDFFVVGLFFEDGDNIGIFFVKIF